MNHFEILLLCSIGFFFFGGMLVAKWKAVETIRLRRVIERTAISPRRIYNETMRVC